MYHSFVFHRITLFVLTATANVGVHDFRYHSVRSSFGRMMFSKEIQYRPFASQNLRNCRRFDKLYKTMLSACCEHPESHDRERESLDNIRLT